jgi:dipeptidyl aminopeptidase/acylaminoacyl peptidase
MDRPQEIYEWDLASAPTARTAINEAFAKVPLVTPEFVRYTSFDGRSIEGALLVPGGQRPAAPMRTVILIHGGPTGAWRDTYETWGQLLAAHGFAVFYPNIRGSTGYGHDFMVLNRGDWGGGDFKDVMAGVDWLVKEHVADPEKLGIAGWSYGGYMASWAITQLQGRDYGRGHVRSRYGVRHRGRSGVRRVVLRSAVREAGRLP